MGVASPRLGSGARSGEGLAGVPRDHAGDEVQRALERLLVHAGEVAAEDADADQLDAAEEQHATRIQTLDDARQRSRRA